MPFPRQPRHDFTVAKISTLQSNQPGIYGIFSHTSCIYIGRSDDLRASLLEHATQESGHAARIHKHRPQYWMAMTVRASLQELWEKVLVEELKPVVWSNGHPRTNGR